MLFFYLKIIDRNRAFYRENKNKFSSFKVESPLIRLIIFAFLDLSTASNHRIRRWRENWIADCNPSKGFLPSPLLPISDQQGTLRSKDTGRARVFLRTWQIQNTSRSGLSLSFTYMGPLVPLSGHAPKEIQKRLKRIFPIYPSYWRGVCIYEAT